VLRVRQLRWLLRRDAVFLVCFLSAVLALEGLSTEARLERSMILEETSLRIACAIGAAHLVQRARSIEKLKREASNIKITLDL
jgi:hypothetical protein